MIHSYPIIMVNAALLNAMGMLLSWLAKGCLSGARFIQIMILDDSMSIGHANQVKKPPNFRESVIGCHRMSSDVIGMQSRLESPRIVSIETLGSAVSDAQCWCPTDCRLHEKGLLRVQHIPSCSINFLCAIDFWMSLIKANISNVFFLKKTDLKLRDSMGYSRYKHQNMGVQHLG